MTSKTVEKVGTSVYVPTNCFATLGRREVEAKGRHLNVSADIC